MNINRHNYEEFFLLYVDNELTAGQRKIVEAFVATNPDLQEEFELIQQSTFTDDIKLDTTFINSLLKPVDEESNISEEQLLLYVDGELRADEKAAVEKELVANSSLQKELLWLRRSQVTADTSIVFPDKSLLYKQAEPARVFSMSMTVRRWSAAAAVVVLLGSAMWLMLDGIKTTDKPDSFIAADKPAVKENQSITPLSPKELVKKALEEQTNEFNETTAATESTEQTKTSVTTNGSVATVNPTTKTESTTAPVVDGQIDIAKTEADEKIIEEKIEAPSNFSKTSTVQPIANNISYASYNNDVADEEDNELLTEERQRKSGIAGFLKKAKRTLERKTGIQSSSSEVRFAVFAVNTQ
ncbi:anti-sigma factor family protein [Lacibacter sp. H407]|uniref:anti-sigma factor family protein n=1 Tax=Lacibacter sp. H407 TaxID=3133423 RepID=UPI0030C40796